MQRMLSGHNHMKLKIDKKEIWRIQNYVGNQKPLPNNQWITEEITKEIRKYYERRSHINYQVSTLRHWRRIPK